MALGHWGRRYSLTEIATMLGLGDLSAAARYERFVENRITEPDDSAGPETNTMSAAIQAGVLNVAVSHPGVRQDRERAGPYVVTSELVEEPRRWTASKLELTHETLRRHTAHLLLPDRTLVQATAALAAGKHLLLVGPPGTGKTELAHALVEAAKSDEYCAGRYVATASADWTTFDTIGGYAVQRDGQLRFAPGSLLRALDARCWLVIDEFNRADVDRAFGELMTVLSGHTSDTSFHLDDGRRVRVGSASDATHIAPPTFRILATMNTWDKTSLFRLSYAVQRRFAVLDVNVPGDDLYARLLEREASDGDDPGAPPRLGDDALSRITGLFSSRGLLRVRALGPAIALDLTRYVRERVVGGDAVLGDALAEGVAMFVLPQLDGLPQEPAVQAYDALTTLLKGVAGPETVGELRGRFTELFPHVRLPGDGRAGR